MSDSNLRIVSLIPSGTEILAALELTNAIVGLSHECDYPQQVQQLPVCTQARLNSNAPSSEIHDKIENLLQSALSIYQIKIDVLEELQPTHIVTQDQCDVCAISLKDVQKAAKNLINSSPQIISLKPSVLQDVWDDIQRVGNAFGVDSQPLIKNLEARLKIVEHKTQGFSKIEKLPTVACIEWTEPLMFAANWIPELVSIAGGEALFSLTGQSSAPLKWETLIQANPDIVIFMPCGFDLNRTRQEAQLLTNHPEWQQLHATQSGRVYITDGNAYFNRPGPRLVDSLEILAEILHPEIFQYGYKGKAWEFI
ncbi:MAG: cobalamin-binding protein [Rhizonema sp. NSF051]|nr:cobalamin-binding protein [Rhizonema sp. NSF051]